MNGINQLVDNSTIKEVSHLLFNKDRLFDEKIICHRIQNLLILTHAILIGNEINYIGKYTSKNESDISLIDKLQKNVGIIKPLNYNEKEEDETIIIKSQINIELLIDKQKEKFSLFFQELDIVKTMEEELKMFLGQGNEQWWKNVGGKEKTLELYNKFESNSQLNIKHYKKINELYHHYGVKNNEFLWLPLFSHIIRTQYYFLITTKEDVVYSPLNLRSFFGKKLLTINSEISYLYDTRINTESERNGLLEWAFYIILEKCKYKRENYFKALHSILESDKTHPIKEISDILKSISILETYSDDSYDKNEIREKVNKKIIGFKNHIAKNNQFNRNIDVITTLKKNTKSDIFKEDDINNKGKGLIFFTNTLCKRLLLNKNINKFLK